MRKLEEIREDLDWAEQELHWATENAAYHRDEAENANAARLEWLARVNELRRELIVAEGEPT